MSLSRGAVKALVNGAKVENPVLQVRVWWKPHHQRL